MMIYAGAADISSLIGSVTWSGDKDQIARKLTFTYAHTNQDSNIRSTDLPLGTRVCMYDDNGILKFDGVILSVEKEEADISLKVSCQDMAFYLKSKVYNTYKGSPAQITAAVCLEFGIQTGSLYDVPVAVEVVSTGEKTVYQVIMAAYEAAGVKVKLYMDSLTVCTELFGSVIVSVLTGDDSVTGASYKSSIENLVDKVLILDNNGKFKKQIQNDADITSFGTVQEIYKHSDSKKSADQEAAKLLKGVENSGKITASVKDYEIVTGKKIMIEKAGSTIKGLFSVVSDSHTISDGEHTVTIGLDFEGVQNEQ